jgi:hypothetical protein
MSSAPARVVFEAEPGDGWNSNPIAHFPLGKIDALEQVSLARVNGPLRFAVPICTLAVLLGFEIETSLGLPVEPAATCAKFTFAGAFSEMGVASPETVTAAGAAPLYVTASDPDKVPGAGGANCTINVQLLCGGTTWFEHRSVPATIEYPLGTLTACTIASIDPRLVIFTLCPLLKPLASTLPKFILAGSPSIEVVGIEVGPGLAVVVAEGVGVAEVELTARESIAKSPQAPVHAVRLYTTEVIRAAVLSRTPRKTASPLLSLVVVNEPREVWPLKA